MIDKTKMRQLLETEKIPLGFLDDYYRYVESLQEPSRFDFLNISDGELEYYFPINNEENSFEIWIYYDRDKTLRRLTFKEEQESFYVIERTYKEKDNADSSLRNPDQLTLETVFDLKQAEEQNCNYRKYDKDFNLVEESNTQECEGIEYTEAQIELLRQLFDIIPKEIIDFAVNPQHPRRVSATKKTTGLRAGFGKSEKSEANIACLFTEGDKTSIVNLMVLLGEEPKASLDAYKDGSKTPFHQFDKAKSSTSIPTIIQVLLKLHNIGIKIQDSNNSNKDISFLLSPSPDQLKTLETAMRRERIFRDVIDNFMGRNPQTRIKNNEKKYPDTWKLTKAHNGLHPIVIAKLFGKNRLERDLLFEINGYNIFASEIGSDLNDEESQPIKLNETQIECLRKLFDDGISMDMFNRAINENKEYKCSMTPVPEDKASIRGINYKKQFRYNPSTKQLEFVCTWTGFIDAKKDDDTNKNYDCKELIITLTDPPKSLVRCGYVLPIQKPEPEPIEFNPSDAKSEQMLLKLPDHMKELLKRIGIINELEREL